MSIVYLGMLMVLGPGCASSPLAIPAIPGLDQGQVEQNPVFIPLGPSPEAYGKVWETVLDVLITNGFEIQESNRFDGRIECVPRVSPGLILLVKPGSPSLRERVLSTLQTYRHRVTAIVMPDLKDGYFIEVIVRKELQDLPRPVKQTAGAAIFRNDNSIERQLTVIDPTVFDPGWIFKGRDPAFESKIIQALKKKL